MLVSHCGEFDSRLSATIQVGSLGSGLSVLETTSFARSCVSVSRKRALTEFAS